MSNSAAAQEPSMEEILASIRRIITDEDGNPTTESDSAEVKDSIKKDLDTDETELEDVLLDASQPMSTDDLDGVFASEDEQPSEDVLELVTPVEDDEEVMELTAAEIEEDEPETEDDDDELVLVEGMDIMFDETEEELSVVEEQAVPVAEPLEITESEPKPELAPKPAINQSDMESLISNQAASSVSESFANLSGLVVSSQAKTMEELLKEMLKPMLQSWLDENLPSMVEEMVANEIRRLSGKK